MDEKILEKYFVTTGTFIILSSFTGKVIFNETVHSDLLRKQILNAIREAENIAFNNAKESLVSILDKLEKGQ